MTRLPTPGSDEGQWGQILNDYLSAVHKTDGTLKDSIITANNLAPNAITTSTIQPATITEDKLDSTVQSKLNSGGGTPGATGPTGLQGLTGATGPSGTPGVAGATGASGTPGSNGNPGATGATGPIGATGPAGVPGATTIEGIDGLRDELDGKAAVSHVHSAVEITSGTFGLERAVPGTTFDVIYDGTDWRYAGSVVSARPTARTDLIMQCVNPVDATVPAWAITGDRLLRIDT